MTAAAESPRLEAARKLASRCVRHEGAWLVPSATEADVIYRITVDETEHGAARCTCEDFRRRLAKRAGDDVVVPCKHILAAGLAALRSNEPTLELPLAVSVRLAKLEHVVQELADSHGLAYVAVTEARV